MQPQPPPYDPTALDAFVALAGAEAWAARIAQLGLRAAAGPRIAQALRQRHGLELAIERLRGTLRRPPATAELHIARIAADAVRLERRLTRPGRDQLRRCLRDALSGDCTLLPLFHMLRTAALQTARGFHVSFAGLQAATGHDLLIERAEQQAEIACEVVSADEGRLIHRMAWPRLADRIDGELRHWLTRHPGRHLLKMTLPLGLTIDSVEPVHQHVRALLRSGTRNLHAEDAVLRLEPLQLDAGRSLRQAFGPEAHLAVTTVGTSVCVTVARAAGEDAVGAAVRRRLFEVTPRRLTGTRPGILAMFIDDTDGDEWRGLREQLALEGEARQFLAYRAARPVIAVTCSSRFEMLGIAGAVPDGELRFRNPAHPAAKAPALGPAILSSV